MNKTPKPGFSNCFPLIPRWLLGIGIMLFLSTAAAADNPLRLATARALAAATPATSEAYGKIYSQDILAGVTLESVYLYNALWTTNLGPAYANIVEQSSNFLKCSPPKGRAMSYALCYYSGPPQPTGSNPANPALPCTLSADGAVANCTCYAINSDGIGAKAPYLVDINAVSNLYVYEQTTASCGNDGSNCPDASSDAAVCDAINTNLLVPGADLVSVFSPLFANNYASSSAPVTSCTGLYAGCMTAPCQRTGQFDSQGNELVNCSCPVYSGPYQIGQANQNCNANLLKGGATVSGTNRYVWSAAYNPGNAPLPLPDSKCTPDMAGKNGCPLYNPNNPTNSVDPNSQLCKNVCASYQNSTPATPGLQVGFTCDSTLCTTVGIGQGATYNPSVKAQASLGSQACQGVGQMANFDQIALVESLANCSCCASQVCGCSTPNTQTNQSIYELNQAQRNQTIDPQCDINGTLCGKP
jgi:hypothetical protein